MGKVDRDEFAKLLVFIDNEMPELKQEIMGRAVPPDRSVLDYSRTVSDSDLLRALADIIREVVR